MTYEVEVEVVYSIKVRIAGAGSAADATHEVTRLISTEGSSIGCDLEAMSMTVSGVALTDDSELPHYCIAERGGQ